MRSNPFDEYGDASVIVNIGAPQTTADSNDESR